MLEMTNAPAGFDPREHIARAGDEIRHYTAIFSFEDGRVASGTFVNACGFYGILTAHHVAKVVFKFPEFGLCVSERTPTGLWVKSANLEHVIIGEPPKDADPQIGPDLSFLIIRDSNLLESLKSLRTFCFLESKDQSYFTFPLERMHWAIAGSPDEAKEVIQTNYKGGPLTKLRNLVGEAVFKSRNTRNDFDYIELKIPIDVEPFPKSYQGVSGGGFWLMPLNRQDDQVTIRIDPILAGVAFHESEPEGGDRIITGHGPDSIYTRLIESLSSRKKGQP